MRYSSCSEEDEERYSDENSLDPLTLRKRKRGNYKCSRCGLFKRGHSCPHLSEGSLQFSMENISPPPIESSPSPMSPISPREDLIMKVNFLTAENEALRQEVRQLKALLEEKTKEDYVGLAITNKEPNRVGQEYIQPTPIKTATLQFNYTDIDMDIEDFKVDECETPRGYNNNNNNNVSLDYHKAVFMPLWR